jgi:hypothetical protein
VLPRNTVTMAAFFFMLGLFAVGGSVHTVASSNDSTRRVTQTSGQVMGTVYNTNFNSIKGLKVSTISPDDKDGHFSATMVAGGAHDEAVPSARQRKSKAVRALQKLPLKGFMLDLEAVKMSPLPQGTRKQDVLDQFEIKITQAAFKHQDDLRLAAAMVTVNQGLNISYSYNLTVNFGGTSPAVPDELPRRERYPLGYFDPRKRYEKRGYPKVSAEMHWLCAQMGLSLGLGLGVLATVFKALAMIPPHLVWVVMLLSLFNKAEAVTCMSCHDGVPGCTGGAACPFFQTPLINAAILGSAAGTHTATTGTITSLIVCATILPRTISRFLTRGVLDFFKSVARRASPGAPVDLPSLTAGEVVEAVRGGRIEISEAISEILARLPSASATEGAKLNTIVSALGQLERVGPPLAGTGTAANGELWGAFTYAWTQAGRVVHFSSESMVQAGASEDEAGGSGQTERRAIKSAKILRPRNVHEFYHMLSVWQMICQAVSLANSLATGAFLEQVVHEQISKSQLTWQQAHELFLVYLEAIETAPEGSTVTIANVYASGGHDMYRERALLRAKEMFKGMSEDKDRGIFRPDVCTYIGQTSSGKPCTTFNLGKANSEHPKSVLDHTGRCKFAHKCDHFVTEQSDGTKGGICGSWKHCRVKCDNPKKCATKVDA